MTNRRGFLGALAALVAAPVMAQRVATSSADTFVTAWPKGSVVVYGEPVFAYMDTLIGADSINGHFLPQPWSDIRRSAARLRAIRRFA